MDTKWAYENGFCVWLTEKQGFKPALVGWSTRVDIARAAFKEAVKTFPDSEINMRKRGWLHDQYTPEGWGKVVSITTAAVAEPASPPESS